MIHRTVFFLGILVLMALSFSCTKTRRDFVEGIIPILPHVNAALNFTAAMLMAVARMRIHAGDRSGHRTLMLSAVVVSALFLVSYLAYHQAVGNVKFAGEGGIRPVYFSILAIHVLLAVAAVPMILATLFRAITGRFDTHRSLAKWTFPVWMTVSVTGVVVYLFAYHFFPSA